MRSREKVCPKINMVGYADYFVITAIFKEIAQRVMGLIRQFIELYTDDCYNYVKRPDEPETRRDHRANTGGYNRARVCSH